MTDPWRSARALRSTLGTDDVPGELLERIRASRAGGMRAVVPHQPAKASAWRALLVAGR